MKRILVLLVLFISVSGIYAQESAIQVDMEFFTNKLKIQPDQRAALSKIIIRKHADLENISSLRNTDEKLFREKRRNIYNGTQGSIKLLLDEEQMKHWQAYRKETRIANASKIKELKAQNANDQDILDAQAGIPN